MHLNKIILTIGLLLFTQSAISQTIQTTVTDSISKENMKITEGDSVSKGTTKIKVIDSVTNEQKRLKFGVGFGLSFIGGTNINLSPNLTYALSEKMSVGAGIQGSYSAIKDLQKTITYGANVITMYSPIRKLSVLAEFAELKVSTETETPAGKVKRDYWDSALFLGAGFNITDKILIGAKYNLLYKEDESVYTSPIIPFVNISF